MQSIWVHNYFSQSEFDRRLHAVRKQMAKRELEVLLVSSPENIFYLTGLDHQGHFAYQMLIIPARGKMILITRAMEKVVIKEQVGRLAVWYGFADHEDSAMFTAARMKDHHLGNKRIGMEKDHAFFAVRDAETLVAKLRNATFVDGSGIIEDLRDCKSPRELEYTKKAAHASDAAMQAAHDVARVGVSVQDVAAELYKAMIQAGSEIPGFAPFVHSPNNMHQEHASWNPYVLKRGDPLAICVSGCYRRYHAPETRVVYMDQAPEGAEDLMRVNLKANEALTTAIKPGTTAADAYNAWQTAVDQAGINYHRHHCGYITGIGFPPSWVGGAKVRSLRAESGQVLRVGMVFHLESWINLGHPADPFVSNTAILKEDGLEIITHTPMDKLVIKS
ncbi:MAG: Xaa-Pro peptidase family protein [Desulfobacterales bacterium]|jgi:Xaa-Pro dipeptidase